MERDAIVAGLPDDSTPLRDGGTGATAYAEAVGVYLGLAVSRTTNRTINALAVWSQSREQSVNLFSRQAIPMVWDYAEVNPFGPEQQAISERQRPQLARRSVVPWNSLRGFTKQMLKRKSFPLRGSSPPIRPTTTTSATPTSLTFSTSGCAALSVQSFPTSSPRSPSPRPKNWSLLRTGMGARARRRPSSSTGWERRCSRLAEQAHPGFPVTIYYAFKQSEKKGDEGTVSAPAGRPSSPQ